VEAHLAECADCRREAAALALQAEAATQEERALLDGLALDGLAAGSLLRAAAQRAGPGALMLDSPATGPAATSAAAVRSRPPARPRWARRLATAGTIAAAASLVFVLQPGPSPEALLAPLAAGSRPLAAGLSSLQPAPYQPKRGHAGTSADDVLAKLLAAKERKAPGAERALAAFYLLRNEPGDAGRAGQLLRDSSAPEARSDLAALVLAQGDAAAALEHGLAAVAQAPALGVARFNLGIVYAALDLPDEARAALAAVPEGPWAAEARAQAESLEPSGRRCTATAPDLAGLAGGRLAALRALFTARTPAARDDAHRRIAALSTAHGAFAQDLVALDEKAAARTPEQLAAHGALWDRYAALKAEASAGRAAPGATHALAEAAAGDVLLAVPALGLEAFDLQQRGEVRAARALYRKMLSRCAAGGCAAESEAIAVDELADAAGHDGDFAGAHRLQDRAQTLLERAGARLQLAELHGKRAVLLAAEGRLGAADEQALRAHRMLARHHEGPFCAPPDVRAQALLVAGTIAADRGLFRAAAALDEAGLAELADRPASPVAVRLARALAVARSLLGTPAEARALVEQERARQEASGERRGALELRAQLALLAESAGDHALALAEARRGLAEAPSAQGTFSTDPALAQLHLLEARALAQEASKAGQQEAQALRAQAEAELSTVVEAAASAAQREDVPGPARALALGGAAREAAVELAALGQQQGRAPASLLAPLDRLRAAALHEEPPPAGWALPGSACLVALIPRQQDVLRVVLAKGAAEASSLPVTGPALRALVEEARAATPGAREVAPAEQRLGDALFSALPEACASARQIALLAEEPLGRIDLTALPVRGERLALRTAASIVSTLRRAVTPRPKPAAGALLVHGAVAEGALSPALPAAALERETLRAQFGALEELTGPAATAEALLARLPSLGLVHAAVHGAAGTRDGGGHLLLSPGAGGEPRLSLEQVGAARLAPGARVVLAACHAASAESGLGLAFLRAGAAAVVAAQGEVDDAAAARWAALFYPALARGLSPAEANREALRGQTGEGPRAWFTVLE
jgi:CHAT domain-containing protein